MACTMLSSLTLQMPMKVASNATEIATMELRWALDVFALVRSGSFLSASSSTNCIGSGSISRLLLHRNQLVETHDTLSSDRGSAAKTKRPTDKSQRAAWVLSKD